MTKRPHALHFLLFAPALWGCYGAGAANVAQRQGSEGVRKAALRGSAANLLRETHDLDGLNLIADGGFGAGWLEFSATGAPDRDARALAERLDCGIETDRTGIRVFTRRFTQTAEFPQSNLEELKQTAKDALRGLRSFRFPASGEYSWAELLRDLHRSFTPAQAAVFNRGEPIPMNALSSGQRGVVTQALLMRAFGGIKQAFEQLSARLEGIDRAVIRTRGSGGTPGDTEYLCGLEVPGALRGVPAFFGTLPAGKRRDSESPPGVSNGPPSSPRAASIAALGRLDGLNTRITISAGEIRFGDLVKQIGNTIGKTIEVQPCLHERRLVVAVRDMPARSLLDCMTRMYGWNWSESETGRVLVERALPKLPRRPSGMSAYLRGVLPADLRAFYDMAGGLPNSSIGISAAANNLPPPGSPRFDMRRRQVLGRGLKKLRTLFDRAGGPDYDLPYARLTAPDQEMVRMMLAAIVISSHDAETWCGLPGAHQFDKMEVSVGLDQGAALAIWCASGNERSGFGASIR